MKFLDYLFHGKELKAIGNYFKMLNGYSPTFTSFSGGVYEMDLTRTAINNFATHCSKLKPEIEGSALKSLEKTLQHKPNYFMDTTKFIKRLATYVAVEHTAFIIPIEDEYGRLCGWYPLRAERCEVVESEGQLYLRYLFANGSYGAIEFERVGIMTDFEYKRKAGFMYMTITEFIEAAAHNKIIQLVVLAIVCDTVFGVLRAIKEKKFNSCAGIDGAIRKVGMLISLVFMLAIDVLIKINLIGFIPEQARTYLGLDTVGVAEFFALLYIAYEVVSIFKNMALCGLPVKKVWEKVREFLAKYTDELPDTDELDGDRTTGNVEEHRTQER